MIDEKLRTRDAATKLIDVLGGNPFFLETKMITLSVKLHKTTPHTSVYSENSESCHSF